MTSSDGPQPGKIGQLQTVAGLIALATGVVAVALVAGGALIAAPGSASSIATAAFGVIGSNRLSNADPAAALAPGRTGLGGAARRR